MRCLSGHPRPSRVRAPVYRGCPCRDPLGCHRVQDVSVTKRQPIVVVVGAVMWCDRRVRVRARVSRSCATENTYTPAPLEPLLELSVVTILSHFHESRRVVGVFSNEIID